MDFGGQADSSPRTAGTQLVEPSRGLCCQFGHAALLPPRSGGAALFRCGLRPTAGLVSRSGGGALAQKWPNDVLLNGGKVAGILLESVGSGQLVDRLTIGIGVNLGHAPRDVAHASFQPIGVADVTGQSPAPEEFLAILAVEFSAVDDVLQQQGFCEVRAEWTAHAARLGEDITARTGREEITGRFEGLDAQGNLLLLTAGGKRVIPAADIYF